MKGSGIELDKSTTKTPWKAARRGEARGRDGFWKIVCTGSHFNLRGWLSGGQDRYG
jgi:hypothetical protein